VAGLVIRWHPGEQSSAFTRCGPDCGLSFDPDGRARNGAQLWAQPVWLILNVILPGALPSILVGLRYALGIMWLTRIVAETIACDNGIGYEKI
jgi:hypothetical protein